MTWMHLLADATTQSTNTAVTGAPAVPPTTQKVDPPSLFSSPIIIPLILMGVFLIFSTRTKRQAEKKVQDMLGNLKRGDRVQTIGGIIGTVVEARETDVLVKVDETNNTKIRFSRKAIHRVLDDESAAAEKK